MRPCVSHVNEVLGRHSSFSGSKFCSNFSNCSLMGQNFGVFLGAITSPTNPVLGGFIGYVAIFVPGILIKFAVLPLWKKMRSNPRLRSGLKGIECGAVGLVYTAVYRLWRIGLINNQTQQGSSIDNEPWFVVVCALSFISCKWFRAAPPIAIIIGGLLGMVWCVVVSPK